MTTMPLTRDAAATPATPCRRRARRATAAAAAAAASWFARLACLTAAATLLTAGCRSETTPAPQAQQQTRVRVTGQPGAPSPGGRGDAPPRGQHAQPPAGPPATLDPSITDPCAARLHDVSGQILLYYAVNRRLPARLEELAAFADVGVEPAYACPASSKDYVYAPDGLWAEGNDRRLIVYDAAPAHKDGTRWGILMGQPQGDQPAAMWVVPMSDAVFRTYAARQGAR